MLHGRRTPAMQNLGDKSKESTWETNEQKCCMASGKGRTPAVQETKVKKSPGRQMNRNAAWPAEKGGHQQRQKGQTHLKKELRAPITANCLGNKRQEITKDTNK